MLLSHSAPCAQGHKTAMIKYVIVARNNELCQDRNSNAQCETGSFVINMCEKQTFVSFVFNASLQFPTVSSSLLFSCLTSESIWKLVPI